MNHSPGIPLRFVENFGLHMYGPIYTKTKDPAVHKGARKSVLTLLVQVRD